MADAGRDTVERTGTAGARQDVQPSKLSGPELLAVLKSWWEPDNRHCSKWHEQARLDFEFYPGRGQWTDEEKEYLKSQKRAPIVFNRVLPMVKAVAGMEINGRHDIAFLPRSGPPDERGRIIVKANETLSAASQWMDDTSDAEDHQSDAFQDMLCCGMGWSEPRVDYDDDPKGLYSEDCVSPLEMVWDCRARKKNLTDAQRIWRKKRMLRSEAKTLFPDVDDADLDCPWVQMGRDPDRVVDDPSRYHKDDTNTTGQDPERDPQAEVHILQVQWWEHEKRWLVAIPENPDAPAEMSDDDFQAFRAKVKDVEKRSRELGQPVSIAYSAARARRKVYRQAFIGRTILGKVGAPQDPTGFTFRCITGEPDKMAGTWFGLVSIARDPQRFANSVLSQTKHIVDTTAKGGIVAEKDAFDDQRQAERTYARPDAITWAAPGAIAKGKIMAKPGVGITAGNTQLLEYAVSSIRDVLGINLEVLGLRDANQPGILEAQRKQAAMTILATLFDSLRRYRKLIGRNRLQYIQRYLADGRLVRISGDEGYQLVQLLREKVIGEYEVIISDAPTSPNQKQETWGVITSILPAVRDMLTPEVVVMLLEFSPLPSKLVDKLKELASKPPPPEVQAQQQLEQDERAAEVEKDRASATKSRAGAMLDLAKAAQQQQETALQGAQAAIAATLAGQQRQPMTDAAFEPTGSAPQPLRLPQPPQPAPAPAETPPAPMLPEAQTGAAAMDVGRVI